MHDPAKLARPLALLLARSPAAFAGARACTRSCAAARSRATWSAQVCEAGARALGWSVAMRSGGRSAHAPSVLLGTSQTLGDELPLLLPLTRSLSASQPARQPSRPLSSRSSVTPPLSIPLRPGLAPSRARTTRPTPLGSTSPVHSTVLALALALLLALPPRPLAHARPSSRRPFTRRRVVRLDPAHRPPPPALHHERAQPREQQHDQPVRRRPLRRPRQPSRPALALWRRPPARPNQLDQPRRRVHARHGQGAGHGHARRPSRMGPSPPPSRQRAARTAHPG